MKPRGTTINSDRYEDEDDYRGVERRREQYQYVPFRYESRQDDGLSPSKIKDVIQSLVTLVGFLAAGFFAWSNLTQAVAEQKLRLDNLKEQIIKDIELIKTDIKEIKQQALAESVERNKDLESLEKQIQELDSTMTQLFQRITRPSTSNK